MYYRKDLFHDTKHIIKEYINLNYIENITVTYNKYSDTSFGHFVNSD